MSKAEYLRAALRGLTDNSTLLADAAVYFYHAEVPLEDAQRYLQTLSTKTKEKK